MQRAQQARADLATELGVYEHNDAGRAVGDLARARTARYSAGWRSENWARWRDRHAAAKEAASWVEHEKDAQQRWATYAAPEVARLDTELARHKVAVEQLTGRLERPNAASRLTGERRRNLHRIASGRAR